MSAQSLVEGEGTVSRTIALGSAGLVRGFRLIGFETLADPSVEELTTLIEQLLRSKTRAFLIVERYLAQQAMEILNMVRSEGGGIVVVEVPPIHQPESLDSHISDKVKAMLGQGALEESP